jgi:hypothetical protein
MIFNKGVLTSIVYFVGLDIYAAIVFHNFQALFGVMNNVNIKSLLHPMYHVITIAIVSIATMNMIDIKHTLALVCLLYTIDQIS